MVSNKVVTFDFETRSLKDLRRVGADVYARDISTEVISLSFGAGGRVYTFSPVPRDEATIAEIFLDPGNYFFAHNATFEFLVWKYVCTRQFSWPEPDIKRFYCTQAMCSAAGLPRSLGGSAEALGSPAKKDTDGSRLMLKMSRPKRDGTFLDTYEARKRLKEYNEADVLTTQCLVENLPGLSAEERSVYLLNERVNNRGLPIDVPLCRLIVAVENRCIKRGNETLSALTGGAVTTARQVAKIRSFLSSHGCEVADLRKDTVDCEIAAQPPGICKQVLEIRRRLSKSSTAKIKRLLDAVCEDGRFRGGHLYHGAGTGRFSGRLFQPQNLPKGYALADQQSHAITLLREGRYTELEELDGDTLLTLKNLIRSVICAPPKKQLIVSDFSSIEARVLAWAAGEKKTLARYRQGADVYVAMAAVVWGVAPAMVTKAQRDLGKATVLGCGYGMGTDRFLSVCEAWRIELESIDHGAFLKRLLKKVAPLTTESLAMYLYRQHDSSLLSSEMLDNARELINSGSLTSVARFKSSTGPLRFWFAADVIRQFREHNPGIPRLWRKMEAASLNCMRGEKSDPPAGNDLCRFSRPDKDWLCMHLPSGREVRYFKPTLVLDRRLMKQRETLAYFAEDSVSRQFVQKTTYGAKLVENFVQAVARDILVSAMERLERHGYDIVGHVHDEVILESDSNSPLCRADTVNKIMSENPSWAKGLPLNAETEVMTRYRK